MPRVIVVNHPRNWSFDIEDVIVVSARDYLTDDQYNEQEDLKVFNLCKSFRYQSLGYYVSLLATARGHRPIPDVATIQELKSNSVVKLITEELQYLIQKTLARVKEDRFDLSIYFGHNTEKKYDKLAKGISRLFTAPLLRAFFVKTKEWELIKIVPIASNEIPDDHRPFVEKFARDYFARPRYYSARRKKYRYDLAILVNPDETEPPSNRIALQKFQEAGEECGFRTELITKEDYRFISEYDALFIRETTNVNHHTYRFSQRAAADGLVVIDDPISIVRCGNKVFLAEMAKREKINSPFTQIVHKDNFMNLGDRLTFPLVVKQPDSQFSKGVEKADSLEEYREIALRLLEKSELIITQEFLQTEFDWRIGVFNRKAIFACQYFMARGHWQIMNWGTASKTPDLGDSITFPLEKVPRGLLSMALKAAGKIGNGLYGIDIKQKGKTFYLVEINDNPNIDNKIEDEVAGDALYLTIMREFLHRVQDRKK